MYETAILNSPHVSGRTAVALSPQQNQGVGRTIVFKPRSLVPVTAGADDGTDKRETAKMVTQESIGLINRPVLVKRGEDAETVPYDSAVVRSDLKDVLDVPAVQQMLSADAVTPEGNPLPKSPVPQVIAAPTVVPQPGPVAVPSQVPAPTVQVNRPTKAVKLSSDNIGVLRLFCRDVVVNDTVVCLIFPLDGSVAVFEPPVRGVSEQLTIEVDQTKYKCFSLGHTFERNQELTIVLPLDPTA